MTMHDESLPSTGHAFDVWMTCEPGRSLTQSPLISSAADSPAKTSARCLGNAVVPQVAEFIGKQLLKVLGE